MYDTRCRGTVFFEEKKKKLIDAHLSFEGKKCGRSNNGLFE